MTKTILITGATDGIGFLTAQKLASDGHKVLIHGRNKEKLANTAAQIGAAETFVADLSRMGEVKAMAKDILSKHKMLDVLINNAGILKTPAPRTEAGRDIRFEVNTIAPYVLTRALLPILGNGGRVVNLSSAAQAPVDVEAMTRFSKMADMEAYAQSKLALTIWSAELAKELPNGPIIVSVNPGSLLASKMVKEGFGIAGNDLNIGADILIKAALSDEFAESSGKYYDNDAKRFATMDSRATSPEKIQKVMTALDKMVGR